MTRKSPPPFFFFKGVSNDPTIQNLTWRKVRLVLSVLEFTRFSADPPIKNGLRVGLVFSAVTMVQDDPFQVVRLLKLSLRVKFASMGVSTLRESSFMRFSLDPCIKKKKMA